jgi:hypothetical protein
MAIVLPQRLVSALSGNGKYRSKRLPGEHGGEFERLRQDARYGDGLIIDLQRMSDYTGVGGEPARPQAMAQQDSFRAVPFAFLGLEEAAQLRLNTEDVKEIVRYGRAVEALGLSLAG